MNYISERDKTMAVKSLNINNTFRNDNYKTSLSYPLTQKIIKVTRVTEEQIEELLARNELEHKRFLLYGGRYQNDTLNQKLYQAQVPITYYTTTTAPYSALVGLQGNPNGEVVYSLEDKFSKEQVRNIDIASSLCRTVVNVPVIYPDVSPKKLLFSLYDLRYILNRVDLDFITLNEAQYQQGNYYKYYELKEDKRYHLKASYRLGYYKYLHEYLARWVIHLNMVCESVEYKKELDKMEHK